MMSESESLEFDAECKMIFVTDAKPLLEQITCLHISSFAFIQFTQMSTLWNDCNKPHILLYLPKHN